VLGQQPSFDSLFLWGNEDSLFNSLLWYIITALLPFLVGKMRRHYLIVWIVCSGMLYWHDYLHLYCQYCTVCHYCLLTSVLHSIYVLSNGVQYVITVYWCQYCTVCQYCLLMSVSHSIYVLHHCNVLYRIYKISNVLYSIYVIMT